MENLKLSEQEIEDVLDKYNINNYLLQEDQKKLVIWISKGKTLGSSKTINLPSKKTIDEDYLKSRVEKKINSNYKNLKNVFKKLDLSHNIYYTSYGIGFYCFMRYKETFKKETKKIENKLNELGIEFKTEFSDARWVYRFKISKSKDNIKRIKNI